MGERDGNAKRLTWQLADAVCRLSSAASVMSCVQVEEGLSCHLEGIGAMDVKVFVGYSASQTHTCAQECVQKDYFPGVLQERTKGVMWMLYFYICSSAVQAVNKLSVFGS